MPDSELLDKIKTSMLLNIKLKNQIIEYFSRLSYSQKQVILQVITSERNLLINYLKNLKNKWEISLEKIRYSFQKEAKQKIKLQEKSEIQNENVEDILLALNFA